MQDTQTDETDRQTDKTDRRTVRIPAQGMEFHRTTDSQTARQTVEYLLRLALVTQEDVCTDRRKHLQRRK